MSLERTPTVTGCTFQANYVGVRADGGASAANISGNTLDHDGAATAYLISSEANAVEALVSQNTLLPRADGKQNRLRIGHPP